MDNFYTQPNDLLAEWQFSTAELLVGPTHQELNFPIGKVGERHTECVLVIVVVGISYSWKKNHQEKAKMPNAITRVLQNLYI